MNQDPTRTGKVFQQRHFEQIAGAIQEAKRRGIGWSASEERMLGIEMAEQVLIELFSTDNQHFDRARFELACTPGNPVRQRHNWSGPAMPYVAPRN